MRKRIMTVAFLGALFMLLLAGPASAHNAAHVNLPTGVCVNVGSFESVTLPDGAQAGSIVEDGEKHLDLIEGSGDQYGARLAAEHSPAVEPRGCP
jgi:hypothetical protein